MSRSKKIFSSAKKVIPAGVNSPVRFFEPYPFFVKRSRGSSIWDVDGKRYLDFCNGYGALLLGHSNRDVLSAVRRQLADGTMYGAPTEQEVTLAEMITREYTSMQKVRLVNSGSEATMAAIRLARGFTKKKKIIKFEGCYHGAHDSMLVRAGSGSAHNGISVSEGVLDDFSKHTLVVPYNNSEELEKVISKNRDVAGVIVEPVLGNMGLILPEKGYLSEMRRITKEHDVPLIFDEVITGFRMSLGGAQGYFGIKPDITTLGKALGNGFVISAVGGRRDIMDQLAPLGKVYEASTFAGNPVSVAASIATIKTLKKKNNTIYSKLERQCNVLARSISDAADDLGIDHQVNHIASMFQIFFSKDRVTDYASSKKSDSKKFTKFFKHLLKEGMFVAPSQFETGFLSDSHTIENIEEAEVAFESALKAVKR